MKKLLLRTSQTFLLFVLSYPIFAQDGVIDVSFGGSGIVQTTSVHEAFDMAIQSDGKIIVVGSINMGSGNDDMAIVRYNSDGSLDNSFGSNGIVNIDFLGKNDEASSMVIQPDGKIVVVGRAQNSSNNNSDIAAIRLTTNGTLDNTFGNNGKYQLDVDGYAFDYALDIALQSDGKLVFVANAGTDMFAKSAIVRLNANGTLDNSFDGDGILKAFSFGSFTISTLHSIALQADGKILIAGSKNNNFSLARLNSDGSLDITYATNGIFSGTDMATNSNLFFQSDGKLVATFSHATQTQVVLVRITQNGNADIDFGNNGKVTTPIGTASTYDFTRDLVIQPNGKILLAGSSYSSGTASDYLVVRYHSDGTIDNTFGSNANGIVTTSVASTNEDRGKAIKLQSDGKIVVAGSSCTGSCDFVLLRYNNTQEPTGIYEGYDKSSFTIYPNPNKGQFTLHNEEGGEFDLLDITGKVLNTYVLANSTHLINEVLPTGFYFIKERKSNSIKKIIID